MPWLECTSKSRGCLYWWHTETQASTFDRPAGLIVPASSVNIVPAPKTKVPGHQKVHGSSTDDRKRKRRAAGQACATAGTAGTAGHPLGGPGTATGPRPPDCRIFPVPALAIRPPPAPRPRPAPAVPLAAVGLLVANPEGSHLRADPLRSGLAERRRLR